jgi:hypothetical protein
VFRNRAIVHDEECFRFRAGGGLERFGVLARVLYRKTDKLQSELRSFPFDLVDDHHSAQIIALIKRSHTRGLRQYLSQQFNALWPKRVGHEAQAGNVPAGTCKTRNQPRHYRVSHTHHHDRNSGGSLFGGLCCGRVDGNDRFDVKPQKFFRERRKPIVMSGSVPQL